MLYTKELAKEIKEKLAWLSDSIEKMDEDESWTFDVIATTEDVDRDGEVIKVSGWDTSNWMKNPVILANHNYTIENIVGKGLSFYTSDGKKRLKGVFSKTNPLGRLARSLYNEGMLKTVSVWFIPKKRNEDNDKVIEEAELLEVSFVAVPCNAEAVSLDGKDFEEAKAKGLIIEKEEQPEEEQEQKETKEITLKDIHGEIQEIKWFIKGLADDKVNQEELDSQAEEAKAKKELLQDINKATSSALEKLKKL